MEDRPASEKTEQPTPKRLEKARQEGQVAQSQEFPAAVSLAAVVLAGLALTPFLLNWFTTQLREGLYGESGVFADPATFVQYLNAKLSSALFVTAPLLAALLAGAVLSSITVSGWNFSLQPLKPRLDQLDPVKGFEKLFTLRSLIKLAISAAEFLLISIVVWRYLENRFDSLASLRWAWSAQLAAEFSKLLFGMLLRVCAAVLVIAAAEVVFQKWKYMMDMKMTKQEVKQEQKDTEGSPELKLRIRRIQIAIARKRMLQEVPKADVIIVNPTHVAVALKYDPRRMSAPVLTAKGADHIAEKIREIARAYGVPIIRKPELARTIFATVKEGQPVPSGLYTAVAEVLAMVYRLRRSRR
ncbi:MAG: flagellar biosynthesis protein FlhB [Phycisphaerae bacterium]|nr:flagellar biosynthesis protein FlhB [Phycisphaerae bacterium]